MGGLHRSRIDAGSVLRKALLFPYQIYIIFFFFLLTLGCGVGSSIASFFDPTGNLAHRCLKCWARACLAVAGLRVQIKGLERLDPGKTYVFMPTHASFLDILLVFAYIPHNFRVIVKEEIFSNPFLGLAVRSSGQLPIDRKNPKKGLKSLRQAADLLQQGISVVAFPEGSRTPNGIIQEFKVTIFVLPIRTRVPVVPVLIEGTFQALKRGSVLLKPFPINLTFYDPIPADSLEDQDRRIYAEKVRRVLSG